MARADLPTYPSTDWFDTGGDPVGDADPKFDLTGLSATYPQVGGDEWAAYRFETGESKDEVTSTIGIVGYLDTDHVVGDPYQYETRFFTMRSEFYEGPQTGNKNDVVLVIQQWSDTLLSWQTTSFLTYASGSDLTGGRPERDGGNCQNNNSACRGWIFDSGHDLAPSHANAADRVGVAVLTMTMADLGATTPPDLLATTYNATAPLTDLATTVAHNIFDDGNPCNDPAAPYYDVETGTCTTHPDFMWKDSVEGQDALATPVSIDLVERVSGGMRVSLIAVHGPTFLELWWQPAGEAFVDTGVSLAVREPGIYTLVEDRERPVGTYAVVDRGLDQISGIYSDDGSRLDSVGGAMALGRGKRSRETGHQRLTQPLRQGRSGTRIDGPAGSNGSLVVAVDAAVLAVDVPDAGGVARVPARVGGEAVRALWVEGERHSAFACSEDVACALVPPSEASRPQPVHRAALLELGQTRPVVRAPRASPEEAALLVARHRLPTKSDISQWRYPVEESRALGWLVTPWFPKQTVVVKDSAAELVALELQALSLYADDDEQHALSIELDGTPVEDLSFRGPRAQLRVELETSFAAAPRLLSLSTRARPGGKSEFLALTGAVLEHVVAPVVGGGFHAFVRRAGTLSLDEDAVVIVRRANGSEVAWHVPAGKAVSLRDGDDIAVTPAGDPLGMVAQVHEAPSLAQLAASDVVIVVGASAEDLSVAESSLSPWVTTLQESGLQVAVASFATVAAAFGVPAPEGVERVVGYLSSQEHGPRAVIIAGSGTLVPEKELPNVGALHVPAPRRWHAGYHFSSDVAPALDEAAAGGRLMPVTRIPVATLDELASVSSRFAAFAEVEPSSNALVVADGTDDFSRDALRVGEGMLAAGLDVTLVDGRSVSRSQAGSDVAAAAMEGVGTLWYIGHGSFRGLGPGMIYPSHLRSWAEADAPPFTLIAASCYAGNVGGFGADRMTDMMFRRHTPVRGGLLGAGQIDVRTHRLANGALTRAARTHTELGAVWAAGMGQLLAAGVSADELSTYALVGDPFAPLH